MTKAELITSVTESVGRDITKKAVEGIVNAIFQHLKKGLKKDKRFAYPGFGTLSVRRRAARNGRNPRTSEAICIPAHYTVVFIPSATFKRSL